ncbi:hypothetical protein QZH41_017266 [Actinostola sp. cb2023]|nr:hypothetical protein QZH41_017266 [Actinostola sp. cb2023]
MAKYSKKKNKKTPKKKHNSKVKKLIAINAKTLSKAQRKHIKDFGELHPIDSSDSVTDNKNVRKVQYVESTEDLDSEEEENAYQQLVGSLGAKVMHPFLERMKEEEQEMDDSDEDDDDDDDHFNEEVSENELDLEEYNGERREGVETSNGDLEKGDTSMIGAGGVDDEDEDDDDDNDDYRQANNDDDVESDTEDVDTNQNVQGNCSQDPFTVHFEQDLDESIATKLTDKTSFQQSTTLVPSLGTLTVSSPTCNVPVVDTLQSKSQPLFKVKAKLCPTWMALNKTNDNQLSLLLSVFIYSTTDPFSPVQRDLYRYIGRYQDVFFTNRNFDNGEEIRRLYCLHAVNHILKTRSRVLKNNAKVVLAQKEKKELEDLRDRGLTRPKVLILVPFRDSVLKIVNIIMDLLIPDGRGQVMSKKRFLEDYSESDVTDSKRSFRPDDFEKMFTGNIDDCFRIGLSLKKNSIKLYSQFYSSDIIIASPLGLRTVIGSEGETFGDFDFLSSIEVLVLDQADVFLMQNWEHVQHVFDHLHKQPKSSHDVDFSRVRNWCLNGWSKLYRQTLLFSSFISPELNSLFNKHCYNILYCIAQILRALLLIKAQIRDLPGSICQVVTQVPQVFHRIDCVSFSEAPDKRFEFFTSKILPEFRGQGEGYTAVFVPSYFDFVRLRNYFRREEISFAQISEYSKRSDITRARNWFKEGIKVFLLYTERFYFFYRYRMRGIKNIIFYGLPHYAHFYPEILNYLDTGHESTAVTCTAVYSNYDNHRLSAVVGSQRCSHMISSNKHVHMFVTGE